MKPEVRIELTRQLHIIKSSSQGANTEWLFLLGTVAEVIGGIAFIGVAIRMTVQATLEARLLWTGYAMLSSGVILLGQAAYITFNRITNRRLRLLYEALLDATQIEQV